MRIELTTVSKGRRGEALPPTSLAYVSGEARLALAETEQRPTVLGLIASGRMAADAGTVTVDGRTDAAALRRAIALVDGDVQGRLDQVTARGASHSEAPPFRWVRRRSRPRKSQVFTVPNGTSSTSAIVS